MLIDRNGLATILNIGIVCGVRHLEWIVQPTELTVPCAY
jgi:hypothetical protein